MVRFLRRIELPIIHKIMLDNYKKLSLLILFSLSSNNEMVMYELKNYYEFKFHRLQ